MLLSLLSMLSPAHAFCGHYVGGVGDELYSRSSEVAIVRQDGRTTMTFKNEYSGSAANFALLLPVPVILGEQDVRTVDPEIIERLRAYTEPRLVEYYCDTDGYTYTGSGSGFAGYYSDSSSSTSTSTVEVIDEFVVGNYEIVILSAEQSTGLLGWLNSNGYATSDSSRGLLQEYIDLGSYFFAAKVSLTAPTTAYLEPLQVGYDYPGFGLPVRLGTLNAGGCDQDLIIYTLTETDDGLVRVSNLPEATLEDDCLWDPADFASLDELYEYEVRTVMDAGPSYAIEYGWPSNSCDPCATAALGDADVQALGFQGSSSQSYTTRLHLRYDADDITTDLLLEATHTTPTTQQRYIIRSPSTEADYPVCNRGWLQEPMDCDGNIVNPGGPGPYQSGALPPAPAVEKYCPLPQLDTPGATTDTSGTSGTSDTSDTASLGDPSEPGAGAPKGCGCGGSASGGLLAGLLGLGLAARLRRDQGQVQVK